MILGAVIGAAIGYMIWAAGNKGHYEPPNYWVWDRRMGFFKGIGVMILLAAIGAGIGAVIESA